MSQNSKSKILLGAEARVFLEDNCIVKERFEKKYRHKLIDEELRKQRTRREAKILEKISEIKFAAPKVSFVDDKNGILKMEFIEGELVKNVLNKQNFNGIGRMIGSKIATLHSKNIIHGDLTTSNMIIKDGEIFFIDFGLGFFSDKVEDKAVDLHLVKQALESKHHEICNECFRAVLEGYKSYKEHKKVIDRLKVVESRGRNKH